MNDNNSNAAIEWKQTVYTGGYHIREAAPLGSQIGSPEAGRYVIGTTAAPGAAEFREYDPMETPALFLQFADAHPASEEEIISLAKRFGFLFADQVGLAPVWAGGELVSLWCREIKALHDAVTLWEAPSRTLKKWFRVEQPGMSYSGPLGNYVVHHEGILNPSKLFGRPTSKLSEGASFVLQRSIDAKLREHNVSARFVWDSTRFTSKLCFQPSSLASALWLQLAEAIDNDKSFARCVLCRKAFTVTEDKRADSTFCGNACRQRSYRARQKRARELRASGASLRAIARELGSNITTIKGWVTK